MSIDYDALSNDLRVSRSASQREHGPGAWDVADVIEIVKQHDRRYRPLLSFKDQFLNGVGDV